MPSWTRTRRGARASTASPTKFAPSKPCATSCAARRCGWQARTATATPTRTCRPTSTRSAAAIIKRSTCRSTPARSSTACERRCTRHWPNSTRACHPDVRITSKRGGWISLTPLLPRPSPANIEALKAEVADTWPLTSLLDIVKEADLRLGFTDRLRSSTAYEALDRAVLRPRLLLCLNGLGTNAGLKRMNAIQHGATYKDLLYARRRYVTVDQLREAIATVANGTLNARDPLIWGEGTNTCASDSKHFGAWDQNLTTQWHIRYGGRGVMISWHVERKSLGIHSQLKSPSSSEVASMIEGVMRHCTELEVDRQYVDSHGQSVVAFAFTKLLGFQLLPRLKAIHAQRLYRPDVGQADAYL